MHEKGSLRLERGRRFPPVPAQRGDTTKTFVDGKIQSLAIYFDSASYPQR